MAPALRNRTRARRAWVVAALAGAALVAWTTFPDWGPSPLRPDPGAAWELQFGRGSGLDGLDTVKGIRATDAARVSRSTTASAGRTCSPGRGS